MSQATRILIALIGGIAIGILAAALAPSQAIAVTAVTQPIGSAWLHGLQMVIVPLIVSLLVTGIGATAEAARAGRITIRALVMMVAILWAVTIMSALVTPLLLEAWPLPAGLAGALRTALTTTAPVGSVPGIGAFFDTIVPTNVVAAAAGDAFLPLTVFALAFAFAVTQLPEAQRSILTGFFQAVVDALLIVIGWVLKLAPIGIFALAYGVGARTGTAAFGALVHYIVCVSAIGVVVLIAAYPVGMIGGRVRFGRFARAVAPAQAVAISTQSSLASLPAMLKGSVELGAAPATAGIVLPLAVAVFRATSPAMNLAVALYVAHLVGVPIGPGQLAAGIATAAITTMGSVSLPGTVSFIASVAPVAIAMGVPIEALGLFIAVETVPDLFRTVGNVTMDTAVTISVSARSGSQEIPHEVSHARP
ncbi:MULTISPECIES: cation:dicarboxylase symporter family transporter [unclassified Sphingomonas]|uniref:dicarboxylate/amino acid:cation symporter n=1 Tax=unclassified Sphingomonas TaxID=196159 RepID=UPI000E7596AC|nr:MULTISPECIES: cation:dicarboxylase symporter family transporter [unclassified Sphingomonas]RKE47569.1 Na+/H+-dicarboxylate symporter [Sphingomonas sp. PP-CC-1A-547]TCM07236.1 Na+/H+-dicarboxylate symporter [Sphingomonas sp. PP-CC-3G-468]